MANEVEGLNHAGGIVAGAIALLATFGGGARWLLNWNERRAESRSAKLQKWSDELDRREAKLDAEREAEIVGIKTTLSQMSGEHHALFQCYHLLAAALIKLDPVNPALTEASALLSAAYRIDRTMPANMAALLGRIP